MADKGGISYERTRMAVDEMQKKRYSNKDRKEFKRKVREKKLLAAMEKNKRQRLEKEEREKKEEDEQMMKTKSGRLYTISMALPGSILDNAQSLELRAYLAGQVARAAAVFNVDEIVIFDEMNRTSQSTEFSGLMKSGQGDKQLFHILQYLECPQYLRKSFFPKHPDLAHAGLLNPLDTPHHLRESDRSLYREGVILKKPSKDGGGSYADIGLRQIGGSVKECLLNMTVPEGQRVTVKLDDQPGEKKSVRGTVVSPNEPRENAGIYWGYVVRRAACVSEVLSGCPWEGGYDLCVGTSDKGDDVAGIQLPAFKHAMIVFGGLKGLEASIESDQNITIDDPKEMFQHYVNVCPGQGSRTIRTEEAILIAMSALTPKLLTANAAPTTPS